MKTLLKNALSENKKAAIFYIVTICVFLLGLLLSLFPDASLYGFASIYSVSPLDVVIAVSSIIFILDLAITEEKSIFKMLRCIMLVLLSIMAFTTAVQGFISISRFFSIGSFMSSFACLLLVTVNILILLADCGIIKFNKMKLICFIFAMVAGLFSLISGFINISYYATAGTILTPIIQTALIVFFYLAYALAEKSQFFPVTEKPLKDSSVHFQPSNGPTIEDKLSALKLKRELGTVTEDEYNAQIQELLSNF